MPDLLTLLHARGYSPRRVSDAHGGEYASACPGPACRGAGRDRFHIWPERENESGRCRGRYWCRQCDISGDTIRFLMDIDGMSFVEACEELGIPLERGGAARTRFRKTPAMPVRRGDGWAPREYPEPPPRWRDAASAFLADCQKRLEGDEQAQRWLAARGIPMGLARRYGLGYNRSSKGGDRYRPRERWGLPAETKNGRPVKLWLPQGWVIPALGADGRPVQLRIRRRNEDIRAFAPDTKYLLVKGSSMATMLLHPEARIWAVAESGFDAILLAGLFGGKLGAASTWNSSARPDARAHRILSGASLVLGALDYDPAGDAQQPWWQAHYPQYRRLPALPGGAKDPGDAFAQGADVYAWLRDALPRPVRMALTGVRSEKPREPRPACHAERSEASPATSGEILRACGPQNDSRESAKRLHICGREVWVTESPAEWRRLAAEGKAVFDPAELERLRPLLGGMDAEERERAVGQIIDCKEILCGRIVEGRA